jgi:cell volume regulation protein A
MFVVLGLLVFPSRLPAIALESMLVAGILILIARPVAVFATLVWFRLPIRHLAFISWVGLRGATPIILATFPVAAGVADGERLFDVVFFVVITSVLVQGTTIGTVARRLGLGVGASTPTRRVSFDAAITGDEGPDLHEVAIAADSSAVGRQVIDLGLPQGVLIVLVRRSKQSFMPQGTTTVAAGDELLIAADPAHNSAVAAIFDQTRPADEHQ